MNYSFPLVRTIRGMSLAAAALALAAPVAPALSQDTLAEKRLRKIEAEIRALQRKVFPGGDGRFFEPEITQPDAGAPAPARPATSAVTDLLVRMDALEAQLARLTEQTEQNSNRISQLEMRIARAEPAPATAASGDSASPQTEPSRPPAPASTTAEQANLNAMTGGASAAAAPAVAPPTPPVSVSTPERLRAVGAIVKPQTEDPGDDEYTYGFRLWEAKFYPEAQQQLRMFLEKYPTHMRASWGRNLLGRAYLDDGNPREAAKWFLQNYQADKSGARAADSLLFLALSMKQLGDTKRACIALGEFGETYVAEAAGRLKGLYDSTSNGLACSG